MLREELVKQLENHQFDDVFAMLSGKAKVSDQCNRYLHLIDEASKLFDNQDMHLFSAPGRTEIGGNHTDHQKGRVLAGSVNVDIAACVVMDEEVIEFVSEGFHINPVKVSELNVVESEYNTSESLIRGTLARFKELGYNIGGFKCYSNSEVLKGSGISSSAAFEVLIGTILSHLYNDNKVSSVEIAQIGQYAENVFFNKPCGLMDQMACSVGGLVTIDFKDTAHPIVEQIEVDFEDYGYHLVLVDTKGSHADLSDEYGVMPQEMKEVARALGKEVLSETSIDELYAHMDVVKEKCHHRAILRAIHFFNETDRVVDEVNALKEKDIEAFKQLMIESGYSSYMYLQNIYSPKNPLEQNISIGLALSEQLLKGKGAYRVHGGGLAGTIQAIVPDALLDTYCKRLQSFFGDDACYVLKIRPVGGYKIV
ncbi:MAG: galactokinase family protein [Erysipelotrichaceae bacterium]